MSSNRHFQPILLAFIILVTGCQQDVTVPTITLQGTVLLDNVPLADGFIIFYPDLDGAAPVAAPVKNGRFEVAMIPPGQYKAAVRSKALDNPNPTAPVDSGFAAPTAQSKPDPIPLKYREPSIPVDASKPNDSLKIELSSR